MGSDEMGRMFRPDLPRRVEMDVKIAPSRTELMEQKLETHKQHLQWAYQDLERGLMILATMGSNLNSKIGKALEADGTLTREDLIWNAGWEVTGWDHTMAQQFETVESAKAKIRELSGKVKEYEELLAAE
jgi:hypothetical protein